VDEQYMRRCLALAQSAADSGETAVGAVVVRDGVIIGEGAESTRRLSDPTAHAEVVALRAACGRERTLDLSGCELVTTVEPCLLCSYALRRTGVTRVVYGTPAGHLGGVTSSYAVLVDSALGGWPPPPEVVSGLLAQECLDLLLRERVRRRIRDDGG
jgi:tRNA(adenine34) deaminase